MTVLCVIAARGGSQGVPGKNLRPLLGKPLMVWSIEQALATRDVDQVVVSTDSKKIAEVAKRAGASVPFMRPKELAGPEIGKFEVWQHALASSQQHYGLEYECLVDLDCTNPLRDPDDISRAIAQFRSSRSRGVDGVMAVCAARKNPYFNLLEIDELGALKISKSLEDTVVCRQDAPLVYEHVAGPYVLDARYVERANYLLEGHIEGYDIGQEKSFDIDSEFDFVIVELLMRRKHLNRK